MASHLLQMRGLKPDNNRIMSIDLGVASFTDAWIETTTIKKSKWKRKSHLLQMRGLKPNVGQYYQIEVSRIFYRCVD